MKLAIIGSRNLTIDNLEEYIPDGISEIVSGGAKGIDTCAEKYAHTHGIKLTVFLPDYKRFGRYVAPLKRNMEIIEYSDHVIAFWDGISRGTLFVINKCREMNKNITVYKII